jgi:hypothetical protein
MPQQVWLGAQIEGGMGTCTWNDALMGTGAFWEPFLGPRELGIGRDVYRGREGGRGRCW